LRLDNLLLAVMKGGRPMVARIARKKNNIKMLHELVEGRT